jgi:hypothetical protein
MMDEGRLRQAIKHVAENLFAKGGMIGAGQNGSGFGEGLIGL